MCAGNHSFYGKYCTFSGIQIVQSSTGSVAIIFYSKPAARPLLWECLFRKDMSSLRCKIPLKNFTTVPVPKVVVFPSPAPESIGKAICLSELLHGESTHTTKELLIRKPACSERSESLISTKHHTYIENSVLCKRTCKSTC